MPCPVVCKQRIQEDLRITTTPGVREWNLPTTLRPVEEGAGTPTRNCLGWARAATLTNDQLAFLESANIMEDAFPTKFPRFQYNVDLFEKVSLALSIPGNVRSTIQIMNRGRNNRGRGGFGRQPYNEYRAERPPIEFDREDRQKNTTNQGKGNKLSNRDKQRAEAYRVIEGFVDIEAGERSDNVADKHGPDAIWGHLKPVIDFIKEKLPTIRRIHFWSDGPSSQYRQKYNFFLFCEITQNEGFHQATWSFFEASHGKGAADGVGGVVKRTLDARVAYGKDIVDAKSVFEIILESEISVKTFYVSYEDIENIKISNPATILPIPSTMTIHQVIVTENKNTVKYRPLSCFCSRDSSSEGTDTEIEYVESDQSDWIEDEYFDDNDLKK
ncbi:unnamed protein product, partial [Brenthis ino]